MEKENDFVPVRIGEPDFPRMSKIREKYELLCSDLAFVASEISHIQNEVAATMEQILEFIQSKEPLRWLTVLHVESHGIRFPGLSTEKLIKNKLVEIPDGDVIQALKSHNMINDDIRQIEKTQFLFPLAKLWGPYEQYPEESGFRITAEFEDLLEKHCSVYTRNENQNKVLPVIKDLLDCFNKLHRLKLVNLSHGLSAELNKLMPLIEVKGDADNPAILNKARVPWAFKEKGDSFNIPNWSAKSLFDGASAVLENDSEDTYQEQESEILV